MDIMPQRRVPSKADALAAARAAGFELAGVARAEALGDYAIYNQWVEGGLAGGLNYLTDHRAELREDPRRLLATAKSVLCVGKLYKTRDVVTTAENGTVSRYAWGTADYHEVLRVDLEQVVARLTSLWGEFDHRICVDTAPLLERSLAREAGLGWIGKNTCLIHEGTGSWYFLGEILLGVELEPDAPPPERCGTCRRCIEACPTEALVERPKGRWQLDAGLCISTLTIETRGTVPEETRSATGMHVFGCDICQDVCPWNRKAPSTEEAGFQPRHAEVDLEEAASLTVEGFREAFRGTPVYRTKHAGWLRNVAIAMGNSGEGKHRAALERLARSEDAGVADAARWALGQRVTAK